MKKFLAVCFVLIALTVYTHSDAEPGASADHPGEIMAVETPHGAYLQYVPRQTTSHPRVLVIVHGSLEKNRTALDLARRFIARWLNFAETKKTVLIAPAFDRHRYQSYGGYRGLFGRDIGADEFVNLAVDQLKGRFSDYDGRFYLYGHSAGGQFAVRYCVTHPERVHQAVFSAPGRYAFPNRRAPWPYGSGRLHRPIRYKNPEETKYIDIEPDFSRWQEATKLPITIVVGALDREEQPNRPGHRGKTRVDLARNWAADMNALACGNDEVPRVEVHLIDGVGHSSKRLTPYCQEILLNDRTR